MPILLIIINCILYEWVGVFELEALQPVAVLCKVLIPLYLLLNVFPGNFYFPPLKRFIYCFAIFMAWGAFSTSTSNFFIEGVIQWIKIFFRFLFCISVCLYFIKRPISYQTIIMKVLVMIGVATVVQYFVLELFSCMGWLANPIEITIPQGGRFYGPYGILGNGTAQFSSFYVVPKFQLTGFWLEPSNAAAFLFMSSFIAEALYISTEKKMWIIASGVCCIGGIFTFANGGYFALGFSLLVGQIFYFIRGNKNRTIHVVLSRGTFYHLLMATSIFLILFSLLGRYVVIKNMPDNSMLKAITGVRGALLTFAPGRYQSQPSKSVSLDDTMMQRAALVKSCFDISSFKESIIGHGFRIPGVVSKGWGVVVSASAPVMWLYFTGIVGLIILLLRESQVIWFFVSAFPPSAYQLRIFQAWIVLLFQNMVYGTWMTPLYFLLIALIFSSLNEDKHVDL